MKNITKTILAVIVAINFIACKSKQPVAQISPEEIEVIIPCSGEDYRSDGKYIRASSMGESQDMTLAKKKAKNNTLEELASKIETSLKSVADNYQNATGNTEGENISKRFETLTREIVDVQISNYKTACEKLTKTKKGTYRSYLSYEISMDDLLEPLSEKISQDEVLRIDYNYEKFKKTFNDALNTKK